MLRTSRKAQLFAVLAATSLVIAACGDDDDASEEPAGTTADTTAETAGTTEETTADTTAETAGTTAETSGTTAETGGTTGTSGAAAECPNGDSVFLFVPFEGNQPVGVNWRAGIEHAVGEINEEGGILGCPIETEFQDTQADPDVSKQVIAEGIEKDPYAILGTVFSSSTVVNMVEAQRAEVPQFTGAEAPSITNREENGDNDFIFRTSFGSDNAAPKVVEFMQSEGVESVDIIYKNDEYGAGGRDAHKAAFEEAGIAVGEEILVQPDQNDLSAEVSQLAGTDSQAVFAYMTELETAAFLDEAQNQAFEKPVYGVDVLVSGSVIDLAQPGAVDGKKAHVGLTPNAEVFADWVAAHEAFHPGITGVDHNNIKGYTSVYMVKELTEQVGSFDRVALAETAHCNTLTVDNEPGLLLDVAFDGNGDIDRQSFIIEVVDGAGQVIAEAPPLDNLAERGC
jgi:branched-chain amino acid transport system substrate-binding protein